MNWHTMPQDAGQMVRVEYAADGEWLYRRTTDRSIDSVKVERVAWDDLDLTGDFEPWNGHIGAEVGDDDWEVAS